MLSSNVYTCLASYDRGTSLAAACYKARLVCGRYACCVLYAGRAQSRITTATTESACSLFSSATARFSRDVSARARVDARLESEITLHADRRIPFTCGFCPRRWVSVLSTCVKLGMEFIVFFVWKPLNTYEEGAYALHGGGSHDRRWCL